MPRCPQSRRLARRESREYDVRSRPQSRQTLGGTFNLDWKLGDRTELHFRTLYNASDLEETRYRTRMRGLLRWNATSTAAWPRGRRRGSVAGWRM
jgi:hypothetical protein